MAGARPQRAGGLSGVHIWLIVFVALWLGSTATLIILFTQQEQVNAAAERAQADRERVVRQADLSQPLVKTFEQEAARSQSSLVRVMLDALKGSATRLTGRAEAAPSEAETQWLALVDEITTDKKVPSPDQVSAGAGVLPTLRQMYEWFAAEHDAKEQAVASMKEANQAREEAEARVKSLEDDFKSKLDELGERVAAIATEKDQFSSMKSAEIDDLGKNIAAKQEEIAAARLQMERQQTAHQSELAKSVKTLRDQAEVLANYRSPGPEGTNPLDAARQPIGRILRALPGNALVHIDLGRLDGVRLGMPFSVYPYNARVPIDGRGKATIEVVSVGPHTAECRVVSPPPPDDPILEEDYVGNILLSRNRARAPRFLILGRFDIDYDGSPDAPGVDRIRAFIERFGGELVDEVDASTDFVVVGQRPSADDAASRGAKQDPTAPNKARRAATESADYDRQIEKAMLLAIPRLRQDQFFQFVGIELGRSVGRRLNP